MKIAKAGCLLGIGIALTIASTIFLNAIAMDLFPLGTNKLENLTFVNGK